MRCCKWQWRKPVPPTNIGNEEPDDVDDDDEIILERLEEEMADDYSDEEEGEILHISQVTPPNTDRGMLKDQCLLPSNLKLHKITWHEIVKVAEIN